MAEVLRALGGQCLRLVGIDEDLSSNEGPEKARTWQRLRRPLKKKAMRK
jgi:hypothetical protein